jgi:60 kDa SS-A/Ro ribonucleoprotein
MEVVMASASVFQKSTAGRLVAPATAVNEAGGQAYAHDPKVALAQFAATGCFNGTFYATAKAQLDTVRDLCGKCPAEYIAKVAVYARRRGHMKDMPAFLLAYLTTSTAGRQVLPTVFPKVIDTPKMLRNFVQIIRSGVIGRKSLGTMPRRLVREWILSRDPSDLFRGSVGNNPSLAEVIALAHPKAIVRDQRATLEYLRGRIGHEKAEYKLTDLPEIVQAYERFKADPTAEVPAVPFEMLTALPLTTAQWTQLAMNGNWHMVRMNLNTFARHGVFDNEGATRAIAAKLRDPEQVRKARVFPYQLMAAYIHAADVPPMIREALQDAMEVATANVPEVGGEIVVCPDVSGSMDSPVTGERTGATTAVTCVQVAALVSATLLRTNRLATVLPFDTDVRRIELNPRDSVMTNAKKLAIQGGGTACSAPVNRMNEQGAKADLVVIISDNQSWADYCGGAFGLRARGTGLAQAWATFKARNPQAKLALIDLQPSTTTQHEPSNDVLFVGGFSDTVFDTLAAFVRGGDGTRWVREIEAIEA